MKRAVVVGVFLNCAAFLLLSARPSSASPDLKLPSMKPPVPDALGKATNDKEVMEELALLGESYEAYANYHGFKLDTINVTTEDGVVLAIHRVRQMDIYSDKDSTPVVLSHGFASSSFDFMANPRNESLVFTLADNGYDVWGVNYRGNTVSARTVDSNKPGPKFYYKATWQYLAKYDLPAVMDYILKERGNKKVHIIGHSMGTTAVFAFLSQNHNYDDKIHMFHALNPVSLLGNDTSEGLKFMMRTAVKIPAMLHTDLGYRLAYGRPILLGNGPVSGTLFSNKLCVLSNEFCQSITSMLFNRDQSTADNPHINEARFPIYFDKYPAGATMANIYLFSSELNRDVWIKTDYNKLKLPGMSNVEEYGQDTVPEFDFRDMKVKLALYYSKNDVFTGVDTAKRFADRMKKQLIPGGVHIIDGNNLSHQDTLWAWDARCYIYNSVMNDIEQFETNKHYRKEVKKYLESLDFEDGCVGLPP